MSLVDFLCAVGNAGYIYFDNLFTSLTLLDTLADIGLGGCRTLRENRTDKDLLIEINFFQKKMRTSESFSDSHNLAEIITSL